MEELIKALREEINNANYKSANEILSTLLREHRSSLNQDQLNILNKWKIKCLSALGEYGSALKFVSDLSQSSSSSSEMKLSEAYFQYKLNNLSVALDLLQQQFEEKSGGDLLKAQVLYKSGDFSSALEIYASLLSSSSFLVVSDDDDLRQRIIVNMLGCVVGLCFSQTLCAEHLVLFGKHCSSDLKVILDNDNNNSYEELYNISLLDYYFGRGGEAVEKLEKAKGVLQSFNDDSLVGDSNLIDFQLALLRGETIPSIDYNDDTIDYATRVLSLNNRIVEEGNLKTPLYTQFHSLSTGWNLTRNKSSILTWQESLLRSNNSQLLFYGQGKVRRGLDQARIAIEIGSLNVGALSCKIHSLLDTRSKSHSDLLKELSTLVEKSFGNGTLGRLLAQSFLIDFALESKNVNAHSTLALDQLQSLISGIVAFIEISSGSASLLGGHILGMVDQLLLKACKSLVFVSKRLNRISDAFKFVSEIFATTKSTSVEISLLKRKYLVWFAGACSNSLTREQVEMISKVIEELLIVSQSQKDVGTVVIYALSKLSPVHESVRSRFGTKLHALISSLQSSRPTQIKIQTIAASIGKSSGSETLENVYTLAMDTNSRNHSHPVSPATQSQQSKTNAQKSGESKSVETMWSRKKKRLAAANKPNFDPNKKSDPERWLPLHQRQAFIKKMKKRGSGSGNNQKEISGKGAQGASSIGAADSDSLLVSEHTATTLSSSSGTVQSSSSKKAPNHNKKKKKQGKGK